MLYINQDYREKYLQDVTRVFKLTFIQYIDITNCHVIIFMKYYPFFIIEYLPLTKRVFRIDYFSLFMKSSS